MQDEQPEGNRFGNARLVGWQGAQWAVTPIRRFFQVRLLRDVVPRGGGGDQAAMPTAGRTEDCCVLGVLGVPDTARSIFDLRVGLCAWANRISEDVRKVSWIRYGA